MRKIWDIPGGIHPPENKQQSMTEAIGQLPMPERLVLPVNQHIGAPSRPLVQAGDRVLKGQLLAEPHGLVSAGVHAPTSGTIEAVAGHPIPHPSGMDATCILLQPDGEDRWIERRGIKDYRAESPRHLLDWIRQSGIAGLGGAGFPASVKLGPRQPIDTLIINGTECEPYITADDALMRAYPEEIIAGIGILAHILGNPANVLIGIEDNKPEAYDALAAVLPESGIELVEFPTKYPSGGEKQLIQILTGKEVPSGKLPADLGVVCQNVGTVRAIYRAVVLGEPLITRITTVTGQACARNRNYEVMLGTPVRHLLTNNGFQADLCPRLIMGGPMMGFTLENPDVPVIKTTNCILAPSRAEVPPAALPQPCIRCGICAEACPASLLPQQLLWYAQSKNYDRLEAHNLFDCIECGACAYVCPSNIPLVQYYRAAKGEIRAQRQEKLKADHSRQRFEFHKLRLEQVEAEKATKRDARRKATEAAQARTAANAGNVEKAEPVRAAASSAEDIIRAAKARAEARKASPAQQRATLERALAAARHRQETALENLQSAETDGLSEAGLDKLRASLEEARLKRDDALHKLEQFDSNSAESGTSTLPAPLTSKLGDSPRQQLESKIAGMRARIATTEAKIASSDDATRAALAAGLDKQQRKLAEAEQQLEETATASPAAPAAIPPQVQDAAAAAIARAQARAATQAQLSPVEKLRANLDSLVSRLDKARQRLADAEAANTEHIDTLRNTVASLEDKVRDAKQKLAEAGN